MALPQSLQGVQQALEPRQVIFDSGQDHTLEAGSSDKGLNPGIKLIQRQDGLTPAVCDLVLNLSFDVERVNRGDQCAGSKDPVVPDHSLRQVGQHEPHDAPFADLELDQRLRKLIDQGVQLSIADDASVKLYGGARWETCGGLGQQLGQGDGRIG